MQHGKCSLLSLGGQAMFIKASPSCLPLYYMSIFPTPLGVIEEIKQIQRQFFSRCVAGKKHLALVAWNLLEILKTSGSPNDSDSFFWMPHQKG